MSCKVFIRIIGIVWGKFLLDLFELEFLGGVLIFEFVIRKFYFKFFMNIRVREYFFIGLKF